MLDPLASAPPSATPARTEAELHESLEAAMAARPPGPRAGVWLFVYGSMAKVPPFAPAEAAAATLRGHERRFCIADPVQRGEPERPGLVLGLVPGEACEGVAFRLGEIDAPEALIEVWRREMCYPFYRAEWLPVEVGGRRVHAIAFVVDEAGPLFEPGLDTEAVAERVVAAAGPSGRNLDYLQETIEGLSRYGVEEPALVDIRRRTGAEAHA
jgi:glutathione-specific gamma-glutamylcyclotransferase